MKVFLHTPIISHGNEETGCPMYYYDAGEHEMPDDMAQWLPNVDCDIIEPPVEDESAEPAKSKPAKDGS